MDALLHQWRTTDGFSPTKTYTVAAGAQVRIARRLSEWVADEALAVARPMLADLGDGDLNQRYPLIFLEHAGNVMLEFWTSAARAVIYDIGMISVRGPGSIEGRPWSPHFPSVYYRLLPMGEVATWLLGEMKVEAPGDWLAVVDFLRDPTKDGGTLSLPLVHMEARLGPHGRFEITRLESPHLRESPASMAAGVPASGDAPILLPLLNWFKANYLGGDGTLTIPSDNDFSVRYPGPGGSADATRDAETIDLPGREHLGEVVASVTIPRSTPQDLLEGYARWTGWRRRETMEELVRRVKGVVSQSDHQAVQSMLASLTLPSAFAGVIKGHPLEGMDVSLYGRFWDYLVGRRFGVAGTGVTHDINIPIGGTTLPILWVGGQCCIHSHGVLFGGDEVNDVLTAVKLCAAVVRRRIGRWAPGTIILSSTVAEMLLALHPATAGALLSGKKTGEKGIEFYEVTG